MQGLTTTIRWGWTECMCQCVCHVHVYMYTRKGGHVQGCPGRLSKSWGYCYPAQHAQLFPVCQRRVFLRLRVNVSGVLLQALHHTPSVIEYHSSIPLDGSSTSSESDELAEEGEDGTEAGEIRHHVLLRAK